MHKEMNNKKTYNYGKIEAPCHAECLNEKLLLTEDNNTHEMHCNYFKTAVNACGFDLLFSAPGAVETG